MSNGSTTWTYTYDANGMRTRRTNGSTTYEYVYNGSQLSQMICGSTTLRFAYSADGSPMELDYNGTIYHYVRNLQGDVVAILNYGRNPVVTYTYDAWGKLVLIEDHSGKNLGALNPLRYKGYVYDRETGLYYLESRYYNPTWGRFVNADSLISQESALGNNMFAYCFNNPISYADSTGNFPFLTIAAALLFTPVGGAALQIVTSILSYAGMAVASIFNEDIRSDMNAIGWNPFNSDEAATLNSNSVSFYKGVPVFRTAAGGRSGSFGAIFLAQDVETDTLRHERGHNWQLMMMGIANFGLSIGLPSWREWSNRPYYERPWEITADVLGGVVGRTHTPENINRGYWYLGVSALSGPASYLFLFGEY